MHLRRWLWNARFLSDKQRIEYFPPFWLMRLKVLEIADDWRTVRIRLPLTWISKNMGGSLFGGFQASLADIVPAMACVHRFPGYSVWTRALKLDFQHEGSTHLELRFGFPPELEQKIQFELGSKGRSTPSFSYGYYLANGRLCTEVTAIVAIRPKGYKKPMKGEPA
jgi:acyl-coenzyme A thioesterase PaaI-like protein